jgi:diguanylate cyclase (GGDEF)-like protein
LENLAHHNKKAMVVVVSLDNFKSVNDTYGHEVGDRVLKALSKTLINNLTSGDYIFRYGGEEFVILLKEANADYILYTSEKLRKLANKSSIRHMNKDIVFSVSIGATLVQPGEGIKSALNRADEALYLSKHTGKNKTTLL